MLVSCMRPCNFGRSCSKSCTCVCLWKMLQAIDLVVFALSASLAQFVSLLVS